MTPCEASILHFHCHSNGLQKNEDCLNAVMMEAAKQTSVVTFVQVQVLLLRSDAVSDSSHGKFRPLHRTLTKHTQNPEKVGIGEHI